jgi:hypothetical protein
MFSRVLGLAVVALAACEQPASPCFAHEPATVEDMATPISLGQNLWTKEVGATVCPRAHQVHQAYGCSELHNLEHIKIVSRGILADDPSSFHTLPERCYFMVARDDGTQWFMSLGEIRRFYTEDPRNMAAKEVSQSSGNDSNPYVGANSGGRIITRRWRYARHRTRPSTIIRKYAPS